LRQRKKPVKGKKKERAIHISKAESGKGLTRNLSNVSSESGGGGSKRGRFEHYEKELWWKKPLIQEGNRRKKQVGTNI